MADHKIVAYKVTSHEGIITLQALTASPRGTRIPFLSHRFDAAGMSKEDFVNELEQTVVRMRSGVDTSI